MVTIKFKIVKVYPDSGGVDVCYFTDCFPEGVTQHVQIYPDPPPTGQALLDYLAAYSPSGDWFSLKKRCMNGAPPNLTECGSLTGTVFLANKRTQSDGPDKPQTVPTTTL